jgi:hypothetical protein
MIALHTNEQAECSPGPENYQYREEENNANRGDIEEV